jgi:hypothetical protein
MPHNVKASIEAYVKDKQIDLTQQELSDLVVYLSDRSITPTNAGLNLRTGGKIKNVTVALNARSYNYTPTANNKPSPVVSNQPVVPENTPLTNTFLNHMKTLKNPELHYKPLTAQQKAAAAIRAIQQKYAPAHSPAPGARKTRKSRKNRKTRKARKDRKSA